METGKLYFFTASILNWINALQNEVCKEIIINSFTYLTDHNMVKISAFVIMPNHIHIIWQPIDNQLQLKFMKFTAQQIKFHLNKNDPDILNKLLVNKVDRQYQIWQRNPLATELYSREVAEQKLDYIHDNPCQGKWILCNDPIDYAYSSIRFYELDNKTFSFLTHYLEILG